MATTKTRFLPEDPTTWTAEGMQAHLRTGILKDKFYRGVFGWNKSELQEAVQRANEALARANIKPTETLSRIRFEKGTQSWTQGAKKRLAAEADFVERSIRADRLFCLPDQKSGCLKPLWFRGDMTFGGRAAETVYDFPTVTQKFFQYAREHRKESLKRETSVETGVSDGKRTTAGKPSPPELAKKRGTSPLSRNGKVARKSIDSERSSPATANGAQHDDSPTRPAPQPNNAIVHVAWITQHDYNSFSLEKDFRSFRTWLARPEQLHYNYDEIRRSLRMAQDPQLELFWFEDITGQPWVVKDDHAIPGAIERMHSKGNICFLLARDIEHVRALSPRHRGKCNLVVESATATNTWAEIQNQTVQILMLDLNAADDIDEQDQAHRDVPSHDTRQPGRRSNKNPYMIPGISVSLARILGEQVMRSRIE
jgi:hypothetical protein